MISTWQWGYAVVQLVEALCCKPEGRRFDSTSKDMPAGGRLDCAKGRQRYHLHVPIVLESGNLILPETSRPVQGMFHLYYTNTTEMRMSCMAVQLPIHKQRTQIILYGDKYV